MVDYIAMFNKKLIEFVDDLAQAFPDFGDFKVMKNVLMIACNMTPIIPSNIFNQTAIKYEQQILNRDEQFLLEEKYDDTNVDMSIADKIKDIWKQTDAENKEVIWKYLNLLVAINNKIARV